MAKYVSKYNFDFDIPKGYAESKIDKSNFKNAIANFTCVGKPNFALIFEGTTSRGPNDEYFRYIIEKYNYGEFSIARQKQIELLAPKNIKENVLEVILKNSALNKNFVCYFFRFDERFNFVGGFAFDYAGGKVDDYRAIAQEAMLGKANKYGPLKAGQESGAI